LAAVAAEIFLQDIDHGPQMPAFLDIDLKHVAHVVERGRGLAEVALLLDRGGVGVALDDDAAAPPRPAFPPPPPPPPLSPTPPARPGCRTDGRTESCGPPRAAPAGCPSGPPASSRNRTWPSPWDRPTPRCAGRRAPPGSRPAP